ncbi:MAG: 50S ribosomal protein L32 [Patescibacteria group bacterium]|nr:50S ribosomal protein L32 [Patescibacteria group bacterium]
MGAVPKRKISKGRKNRRRAHHALQASNLVPCPSCKILKKSHAACPNCGKYKNKEVIKTD